MDPVYYVIHHSRQVRWVYCLTVLVFLVAIDMTLRPVLLNNLPMTNPRVADWHQVRNDAIDHNWVSFNLTCPGHPNGYFNHVCIARVRSACEAVKSHELPVGKVICLPEYPLIVSSKEESLIVGDLIPETPDEEELLQAMRHVQSDSRLAGSILSKRVNLSDGAYRQTSLMGFRVPDNVTEQEIFDLVWGVREAFDEEVAGFIAGAYAMGFLNRSIEMVLSRDPIVMTVFALTFIFIFNSLLFNKRVAGVMLLPTFGSYIITLGILSVLGIQQNSLTSALPVIGVATISSYYWHMMEGIWSAEVSLSVHARIRKAYRQTSGGIYGAGITTAVGFFALTATPIYSPRDYGIYASVVALVGMTSVVLVVPAFVASFPGMLEGRSGRHEKIRNWARHFVGGCAKVARKPIQALGILAVLLAIASIGVSRLEVNASPLDYFPRNDPMDISILNRIFGLPDEFAVKLREGFDSFERDFGASGMVTVVIRPSSSMGNQDEENVIHEPEHLAALQTYVDQMRLIQHVSFPLAFSERQMRLYSAFQGIPPGEEEVLPSGTEALEQSSQLSTVFDDPEFVELMLTEDRKGYVVSFFISIQETKRVEAIRAESDRIARDIYGENWQDIYTFGGETALWAALYEALGVGAKRSILFALPLLLFICCWISLGSLRLAALSLIPTGTSTGVVYGVMGLFNLPFDMANFVIANTSAPIGIDFYIHLMKRIQIEMKTATSREEAIWRGVNAAGVPIVFDATSNLSFGALAVSAFVPVRSMAIFLSLSMMTSMLLTLVVVPAFLIAMPWLVEDQQQRRISKKVRKSLAT